VYSGFHPSERRAKQSDQITTWQSERSAGLYLSRTRSLSADAGVTLWPDVLHAPSQGQGELSMSQSFHRGVRFFSSFGLAVAITLLAASGCRADAGRIGGTRTCSPATAAEPLRLPGALAALRHYRFMVYLDLDAPCPPQVARQVSNIFFNGPHRNVGSHQRIAREQGQLYCEVDKHPAPAERSDLRKIKVYRIRSSGIEVVMANVACRLYALSENRAARRAALLRAFDEMRKGL
jgi:hypothetical protein